MAKKKFAYNDGESKKIAKNIELEFGIFIDGTLNNKTNTENRIKYRNKGKEELTDPQIKKSVEADEAAYEKLEIKKITEKSTEKQKYLIASHRNRLDKMGTDNSFSNDYTNVARMWGCCNPKYAIYVEGMGTTDLVKDDDDGFAFGAGKGSGIRARVRTACERLADITYLTIKENNANKIATQITLDVFGFSRGAAAARNFIYEVNCKKEYAPKAIIEYKKKNTEPQRKSDPWKEPIPRAVQDNTRVESSNYYPALSGKSLDDDGQLVLDMYLLNGKMPRMGHLGYSLCRKGIKHKELKKLTIVIRFVGLYDTVSSYAEEDTMGNDNVKKKGISHALKSKFKNDVAELNLNTLGNAQKMVHFTAKDEHRENFDLTRLPGANIPNKQNKILRIEKNFPGVHCDIGGAYNNETEVVDEIEVVNKTGIGGIKSLYKNFDACSKLLEEFGRKELIEKYWYKKDELTTDDELFGTFKYFKLSGKRKMKKEYSYIPLLFMNEFCEVYLNKNLILGKIDIDYSISKYKVLIEAKSHLDKYVNNKGGKEWNFISDAVFIRKKKMEIAAEEKKKQNKERGHQNKNENTIDTKEVYKVAIDNVRVAKNRIEPEIFPVLTADQALIRKLRHEYFHWSANRDWLGMDPNENRKRQEH